MIRSITSWISFTCFLSSKDMARFSSILSEFLSRNFQEAGVRIFRYSWEDSKLKPVSSGLFSAMMGDTLQPTMLNLLGIMKGLVYMHDHDRLHQSLGPASVFINTMIERDADYLIPRLGDLAFSVDIGNSLYEESFQFLSEGLWRRAAASGAMDLIQKRAFGIADDIYGAGLLFAYLAFVPFCGTGIMDSFSLQRLLEDTFQLDLQATREYCLEDDSLLEAVRFLDLGDGAGWELIQAMLNSDYRKRPVASAVLNHRFLTGAVLGEGTTSRQWL